VSVNVLCDGNASNKNPFSILVFEDLELELELLELELLELELTLELLELLELELLELLELELLELELLELLDEDEDEESPYSEVSNVKESAASYRSIQLLSRTSS
jgi:hypothetical protein